MVYPIPLMAPQCFAHKHIHPINTLESMPWTALPLSIINSAAAPNTQTNPQTTLSIPCPSVHRSARITNQYHPYQQMHRWCSNIQTLHFQKYPFYVLRPKKVAALFINHSLSKSDAPCHGTAFSIMSTVIAAAVVMQQNTKFAKRSTTRNRTSSSIGRQTRQSSNRTHSIKYPIHSL